MLEVKVYKAAWCAPCRAITPILESLKEEYKDKLDVTFLDVDENRDGAVADNIISVPTILFCKSGEIVERQVGALTKTAFKAKFENLLEK